MNNLKKDIAVVGTTLIVGPILFYGVLYICNIIA